jgi:hypothetical protein
VTDQLDIGGAGHTLGATGKPLTEKQQRGYDLVRSTPGGITADELGAQFHADRGKHHPDSRCQWCVEEGMGVLDSKAVGPLVIRRRGSGRYEPRDGSGTAAVPEVASAPTQLTDLPGESFTDIFEMGDAAA